MPRTCCDITDSAFSESEARQEARNFLQRGPEIQTQELLSAIRSSGIKNATLLDIGGGIGAIHHELLQDVAATAVQVDASSAYLKEARSESGRRGHSDRVTFIHADFTDVAASLDRADIVTLDRVVCCYPDFHALLSAAADRSRRLLALSYPRESWLLRIGLGIINALHWLRRNQFRTYLHPVADMDALLRRHQFRRVFLKRLFVWEVAAYSKP